MADKTGEQVSALMDCECSVAEMELALRRLARDSDIKAQWQRYHLIGDALKNNLPEVIDVDFAERVRQAIDTSPLLQTSPASSPFLPATWYKPVAGFAVAASVALMGVLTLGPVLSKQTGTLSSPTALVDATAQPEVKIASSTASDRDISDRDMEARLANYVVNHNEYASMNSVRGVLPYVHMVSYQTNR